MTTDPFRGVAFQCPECRRTVNVDVTYLWTGTEGDVPNPIYCECGREMQRREE